MTGYWTASGPRTVTWAVNAKVAGSARSRRHPDGTNRDMATALGTSEKAVQA